MLAEYIEEEIEDAKKYAEAALEYKDSDPEMARMFMQLSKEETGHMRMLYEHALKMIDGMHQKFEQ